MSILLTALLCLPQTVQSEQETELRVLLGARGEDEREAEVALRRLQAYRMLAGLPWRELRLDPDLEARAVRAAELCEAARSIDHRPANPGWEGARYRKAVRETQRCNLAFGRPRVGLVQTVDGYMAERVTVHGGVGHRAWMLDPRLLRVGFGRSGNYAAMHCRDRSGSLESRALVAWPPAGSVPLRMVGADDPWSLHLSWKRFRKPPLRRLQLRVVPLRPDGEPDGEPLELRELRLSTERYGIGHALSFRPQGLRIEDGARYRVEFECPERSGRTMYRVQWVTRFFAMQD